jgi:hypothetical protein
MGRNVANECGIAGGSDELVCRKEVRGLQIVGDIVDGFAFANGKGNHVHLALGELPEHVAAVNGLIEEIFASLECATRMTAGVKLEGHGAANDAITLKQACNAAAGSTARYGDEDSFGGKGLVGLRDAIPQPSARRGARKKKQPEKRCKFSQVRSIPCHGQLSRGLGALPFQVLF